MGVIWIFEHNSTSNNNTHFTTNMGLFKQFSQKHISVGWVWISTGENMFIWKSLSIGRCENEE